MAKKLDEKEILRRAADYLIEVRKLNPDLVQKKLNSALSAPEFFLPNGKFNPLYDDIPSVQKATEDCQWFEANMGKSPFSYKGKILYKPWQCNQAHLLSLKEKENKSMPKFDFAADRKIAEMEEKGRLFEPQDSTFTQEYEPKTVNFDIMMSKLFNQWVPICTKGDGETFTINFATPTGEFIELKYGPGFGEQRYSMKKVDNIQCRGEEEL